MKKSEIDKMKRVLELYRAFRLTEDVPPDIVPPTEVGVIRRGWAFNSAAPWVKQAWTTITVHGFGNPNLPEAGSRGVKGSIPLYSSEVRARQAMRREAELRFASHLAAMDAEIERAKGHGGADDDRR